MADIALTAAQIGLIDPIKAKVLSFIATAAITKGQAVYINSSGKADLADASAAGTAHFVGIALGAAAAGQAVDVCVEGEMYGFTLTGLNYYVPIYLSDTAGALADGAGTKSVVCARVMPLTDKSLTKVLWVFAQPATVVA